MYHVEPKPYGFLVVFEGFLEAKDMETFKDAMEKNLARAPDDFGILVDLRNMRTFPQEAQGKLLEIMSYCHERGMNRNSVVVNSAITKIQASRLAKESGVPNVRFIDAADVDDWMAEAEGWLVDGKEPQRMAS